MNDPGQQHLAPAPVRRLRMLLVLGLLAGLLGMHALAPVGTVHEHAGPQHMKVAAASAHKGCPETTAAAVEGTSTTPTRPVWRPR